jgi:hypothetical protein
MNERALLEKGLLSPIFSFFTNPAIFSKNLGLCRMAGTGPEEIQIDFIKNSILITSYIHAYGSGAGSWAG